MADDANSGDQNDVASNPGQRVSPSSGRNVAAKQTTSRGKSSSAPFHQQQQQTVASSAKATAAVPPSQTQGASRRSRAAATTQHQQQTPPGVVAVPPGCRGPRSLYLKRQDNHGFGFTLRHFIVYPPESCEITDGGRHAAVGAVVTPMDTIFVKRVHSEGAAARAGLRQGDRLVAVNGHSVAGLTYAQVVAFIKHGPPYLHLLVVSQEHDVLQKYFSETAHNPETNQRSSSIALPTAETIDQFHTLNTQPLQQLPGQRRSIMLPQSSTPATANTPRPVTQPWSSLSPHISNEISAANWVATGAGTPLRAVESAESASYYRNREHIYQKPPNDSLSYSSDRQSLQDNQSNIYSEPYLLDAYQLSRAQPQTPNRATEAQPQVPINLRGLSSDRKVRRGSEGSCPSSKETCDSSDYISLDSDGSEMVVSNKSASRHAGNNYLGHRQNLVVPMDIRSQTSYGSAESVRGAVQGLTYPNNAGCRLSLDAGRRESSVSLTSSAAEGSKDSLSSYDSTSTLTGHETDDSAIMSRLRKNFEQKEEFLRRPSQPTGWLTTPDDFKNIPATVIQREFYGRPQKLQKQVWPPNEPSPNSVRQDSPSRSLRPSSKPSHQNLQRIRTDLDSERDYLVSQGNKEKAMTEKERFYKCETDEDAYQSGIPIQKSSSGSNIKTSPRDKTGFVSTLSRIHENIPATVSQFSSSSSSQGSILNGSSSLPNSPGPDSQMPDEDGRYPPLVWRRARQFESGRPIPDDETGSLSDRTSLYSSELARLSSKRVVPNVAVRKREFEVRSEELSRELRRERESLRRLAGRGSRSLESADVPVDTDNPPVRLRARSNSAESWAAAMLQQQQQDNDSIGPGGWNGSRAQQLPDWRTSSPQHDDDDGDGERQRRRAVRQDSYLAAVRGTDRTSGRQIHRHAAVDEQDETVAMDYSPVKSTDLTTVPITNQNNTKTVNNTNNQPDTVPVIKIHPSTPTIPVTPVIKVPAVRPTQLDLSKPLNVGHLDNDGCTTVEDLSPVSSGDSNIPSVVMRRNKNTNSVGEEERAVRRVSYLKATWNDRMHVDSDLELSDTEPTPQILRSNSVSGGSSGSGSGTPVDRTGSNAAPSGKENHPIIKEGPLNCKITVQDFKRATDRSWKQVWAVLRGPTLSLYKDRHHHQSPMGASEADSSLPGVVGSVDVRCSLVDVAGDYTKRKNVLRVSAAGQELLLQAEHVADMAHWVRSLQEQAGQPTSNEQEKECTSPNKQQACPQQVPAVTSIQVQGASRLSPLPGHKSIRKLTSFRNRSPTGQSPVNKTRKPSQTTDNLPSPKSKTWGRVVKQFRKIHHGAGSPSSPTAPEGATIGIPLELCPMSTSSEFVPLLVETCTKIVEERGLDVIGIYRVPGNTAAITLLTEDVNKGFSTANLQDPRWNDVNVVSSLLKSFFRRLPDSLFTVELYPKFIEADKIDDNNQRLLVIRKLVRELPDNHYETLKYLCLHLKRVVEHSEVNKMEARNLAIVFGPTLVRAAADDMVTMVTDMSHQCRIVESLLCHVDWFFSEDEDDKFTLPPSSPLDGTNVEMESATSAANHNLLLSNINKIEGMKTKSSTGKEIAKVVKSSVISAANRKMQRKSRKQSASELCDQLKEDTFSVDTKDSMSLVEMKETTENGRSSSVQQTQQSKNADDIPTMVTGIYNSRKNSQSSAVAANDATDGRGPPIVTYANLSQATQERVRRFEQETRAMMAKHKLEASSRNATKRDLDSSNENMIGSDGNSDNSADIIRKSLRNAGVSNSDVSKLNRPSTVSEDQFSSRYLFKDSTNGGLLSANNNRTLLKNLSASNMLTSASEKNRNSKLVQYDDLCNSDIPRDPRSRSSVAGVNRLTSSPQKMMLRRGSSVESMNAQSLGSEMPMSYNGTKVQNGTLKRLKTGREQITLIGGDVASQHRFGSLDSLDKIHSGGDSNRTSIDLSDDGSDLLTSITTTLDHLFSSSASQSLMVNESIPFVDESPEKQVSDSKKSQTTNLTVSQNISSQTLSANKAPGSPIKLFRNPSLHKTNVSDIFLKMDTNVNKNTFKKTEKDIVEKEKDDDKDETSADNESLPDNDRVVKTSEKNEKFNLPSTTKLKRSESLNKPDRSSVSPSNGKLKRSESLNRSSEKNEKLKRSDSLTKNEKTESNISKRRELTSSFNKKSTRDATVKLKRKNGMPERSIKRRHTVGGTKDFDKVHWLDNRLQNQAEGEESSCVAEGENNKEKSSLRTSSPDLSSSRRERFLFEISLLGPEGMIVALRQHFIGARPQSLPESRVYKVPLESHV